MPLRPPGFPPITQADWDRYARNTPVIPDDNSVTIVKIADQAVTNSKLRDSAPASVIGRLSATPGMPADIAASSDDTFLVRRAGTLIFGLLADADIPNTIARDAEVTAALNSFAALPDPFPQYLTQTEGDARYALLSNVLNGSKTYDPPSLATGVQTTTTVTVTGAVLNDYALASFSLTIAGFVLSAFVSAADTVTVVLLNMTGGTVDLGSGSLKVRVWKQ